MTQEEEKIIVNAVSQLVAQMNILAQSLLETKLMVKHLIDEKIESDALPQELTSKMN